VDISKLHGWYVDSNQTLKWVFENLELQAKLAYLETGVDDLSLFSLHGIV
jgi:hypothetical protein